ncbi:MAG: glycosyltransferase family 2 protein, partial [Candidatus Omnitrophota bacterium]
MDISIVIPTYQGTDSLKNVLDALCGQKTGYSYEVICVDSGSTDGTRRLCSAYPVRWFEIKKAEFNHGLTRNFGIGQSRGKYAVLMTQDAVPANDTWLENLVSKFEDDELIAGIYCRQVPRENADCVTKKILNSWITAGKDFRINFIPSRQEFDNLNPMQKYVLCYFDNVCSCIRKSVWEKFPFKKTYFGEDVEWGKEIINAGYKIAYNPMAAVIHSHKRSIFYEYKRTYLCHRRLYSLFNLQTVPFFKYVIKCY